MEFTINFGAINLLVVFGATVAAMLLAGVWFSPLLFGKPWAAARHVKLDMQGTQGMKNAPATFIAGFILQLLAASMLAALLGPNSSGVEGVQLGTLIAFSFVLPTVGITNLFDHRPLSLILIGVSFHIVAFGLMGYIIGTWG